jgi:MtN3 and saliva related transmembrane protein
MFVIFSLGVFLWLLYGFFIHSVSIVIANGFTLVLSLAILVLKVYYDRKPGDATLLRK